MKLPAIGSVCTPHKINWVIEGLLRFCSYVISLLGDEIRKMNKFLIAVCLALCVCGEVVANEDDEIKFDVLIKSSARWNGSALPGYGVGTPEITILKVIIPPGMTVATHKHPMINAAVLLSGELTVTSKKGAQIKLAAGDPLIELVDQWHSGLNTGNEPVEMLVFYAGIKGQPLSIKE